MALSRWIANHAARTPDKFALRLGDRTLTYRNLAQRIDRLAAGLARDLGVTPGTRIAILAYNGFEYIELVMACARLGAILVPLNWRLALPELAYILKDAGASALICDPEFHDAGEALRTQFPELRLVGIGSVGGHWLSYERLLVPAEAGPDAGDDDAPHLIVYTSGTTGRPKGAVLTQRALVANARNGVDAHDLTASDLIFTFLPMFHVGGLNIQTLPALYVGATVAMLRRFEPGAVLDGLAALRPSVTLLVPAVMKALIEHPRWAATNLASLRIAMAGSSIVPVELLRAFHARGVSVGQVYGSTETAPTAIVLKRHDAMRKEGSTGTPALLCEARVVDEAGHDVARGVAGEILVRGPNVMRGYWNDPEATAEALVDGWFHTGDVGHQDDEGYFWIDERKKDMIISGGENIYPAELEAVIAECPAVAEASVVARADAKWGEVPVAVIVRNPGAAVTAAEIKALFDGRLARFKHPHDVVFVNALPRNVMGKVLRYKLRETLRNRVG
jgi:fatty-acyl-CoA synthase